MCNLPGVVGQYVPQLLPPLIQSQGEFELECVCLLYMILQKLLTNCKGARFLDGVQYMKVAMNLQYPRYHCITPMLLLVDNSDSPSIVEQP